MTKTEYEYRGQAFRVGVALLLLLLLLTVRGLVLLIAPLLPPAVYAWLYPCLDGLLYALAFLLPALVFQRNIYFCFIDYAKAFDCVDHSKLWKILKEMGLQ